MSVLEEAGTEAEQAWVWAAVFILGERKERGTGGERVWVMEPCGCQSLVSVFMA